MYNIEELRTEKEKCKKKIITFSILTAVAVLLIILSTIAYVISLVVVIERSNNVELMSALVVIMYIVIVILLTLAMCAFIPFIVINGVKHGKRRRLLNKIDEGGVIDG